VNAPRGEVVHARMRLPSSAFFLFLLVAPAASLVAACGSSSEPASVPSDPAPDASTPPVDGGRTDRDASGPVDASVAAACTFTSFDTHVSLTLTAVWGAAENDVWVGTTGTSLISDSRLLRFDGTAFGAPIDSTSFDDIRDIRGTATDDVWIAGTLSDSSHRTLLHWDGAALVPATVPAPTSANATFHRLWAGTRTDVWLVGDGTLLRYQGTEWTRPPSFGGGNFDTFYGSGVAGASGNDVILTSRAGSGLRWDGARVEGASTPASSALVRGAKGPYWRIDANTNALASSADGLTWTTVRTFARDEPNPLSLAVDDDGDPWIGTGRVAIPNGYDGPFVEHLAGGVWHKAVPAKLDAVRALAVVGRSVWAVGSYGQAARCMLR
jgi:hypothetical protein